MQNKAVWMARAAGAVFFFLFVMTTLQAFAIAQLGQTTWWEMLLPMPFYLYATGATWWSLRLLSKGARLATELATLMRRAGIALFTGGLVEVFGTNIFLSATGGDGQLINVTAIVIGVVGVGLFGISSLIDEARAAKAELEEFI